MGKRKSSGEKKQRPVKARLIQRKHAGKVVEAYRFLEEVITKYHPELEGAAVLLFYQLGWKPDCDGVLTLAKVKKASDTDRALVEGGKCDFILKLNEEAWEGLAEDVKKMVLDHELCHCKPDLDRDGEQKIDSKDRLCWRHRKHPIQEFPEIIRRYGIEQTLRLDKIAQAAVEKHDRPLLGEFDKADEKANRCWRGTPIDKLDVPTRQARALNNSRFETVGELADHMDAAGNWWHREVIGIGKDTCAPIEDAVAALRA